MADHIVATPLSDQQVAQVVTQLARGQDPGQVAERHHLAASVVRDLAVLHGWPSITELTKHSRELNRRLSEPAAAPDAVEEVEISYSCAFCGQDAPDLNRLLDHERACKLRPRDEAPEQTPRAEQQPAGSAPGLESGPDVVEEPPTSPAPNPLTDGGWFGPGPRTVERLLDEADRCSGRIRGMAADLREAIQQLADAVDAHHDTDAQRKAILHELDILGRRQDELTEKLAQLAETDEPATTTIRPSSRHTAMADANLTAVWYLLPKDTRARIRTWASANGVPHSKTGRQPAATCEAYLAAHPEDDPR